MDNVAISKESFLKISKSFFTTKNPTYIKSWRKHTDDFKDLQFLFLKQKIQYKEIQKAAATLLWKYSNVTINKDALFDEVISLQEFLKGGSLDKWRKKLNTTLSEMEHIVYLF